MQPTKDQKKLADTFFTLATELNGDSRNLYRDALKVVDFVLKNADALKEALENKA